MEKNISILNLSEKDMEIFLDALQNPPKLSDPIMKRYMDSITYHHRIQIGSNEEIHETQIDKD
jgi:uncharacterized protein (DUF1778 family)